MTNPNDPPAPAGPASEGARPASSKVASSVGRSPLLKDKPDAPEPPAKPQLPPRAAARHGAAKSATSGPQPQVSRGIFLVTVSLFLVILLAAVGGAFWFYHNRIAPQLQARPAPPNPPPQPQVAQTSQALEQATAKLAELQRQLDAQREERERTQSQLQEMADRMALVIQQSSFTPKASNSAGADPGSGQMAAMLPSVSPATSELILLKERNRLTAYADSAIATGDREALQRIVDVMMDPEQKNMAHAAQAEFKRVQSYYEMSASIDPGYKLPVRELFKDSSATVEADLSGEQLRKVMLDVKQPWEARLRCAYLLRASTTPGTDEALLKVIKEDPSLDVAKQAQTSFERRVGRRFRLFDIPALEAWWQTQGAGKSTAVPMKEPAR
ncbi:MAG TPA: hypothetical protein VD994_04115 [Prosthecobacter sp.]|nr:hypothetical protein [Prosthecobacter sp.]